MAGPRKGGGFFCLRRKTEGRFDALLWCCRNDGTEFGGSIYQKVNGSLETAVQLAWTAGSNNTRFGIGAKYQLDKDASLSVRPGASNESMPSAQ